MRSRLLVVICCTLALGCKKSARKGGAGGSTSSGKSAPIADAASRLVRPDAYAVLWAPSARKLLDAYLPLASRLSFLKGEWEREAGPALRRSGVDLARPATLAQVGLAPDRPLAVVAAAPLPGSDDPVALWVLPVTDWAVFVHAYFESAPEASSAGGHKVWLGDEVIVQMGDYAVVVNRSGISPDSALALIAQGASIADDAAYKRGREELAKRSLPFLYVARPLLAQAGDLVADYRSVAMGLEPVEGGVRGSYRFEALPAAAARMAGLWQAAGKPGPLVELLPPSALMTYRVSMDLGKMWEQARTSPLSAAREATGEIAKAWRELERALGTPIDGRTEILDRLTGRAAVTVAMPPLGGLLGAGANEAEGLAKWPIVLVLEARDGDATAAAIDRAAALLSARSPVKVERTSAGRWAVSVSGLAVGGVVRRGNLFALGTQVELAALEARAGGGGSSLASSAELSPFARGALTGDDLVVRYDVSPIVPLLAMLPTSDPDSAILIGLLRVLRDFTAVARGSADGMAGEVELRLK